VIRYLRGELIEVGEESAVIDVGGVGYEVFVPETIAENLRARGPGAPVRLLVHHYLALEPSRGTPMLLGFETQAQYELFQHLITVPRLGPRLAARALVAPVASIARAVELGDAVYLRSLPGVGQSKARDIVNALRGKLGRLVEVSEEQRLAAEEAGALERTVESDALEALVYLGQSRHEALQRINAALRRRPEIDTADALVAEALRE